MSFEHFKKEVRDLDVNDLNKLVQERKKLLVDWNRPDERMVILGDSFIPGTNMPRTFSKHPFKKIKKEIAILYTIINQKNNHKLNKRVR